MLEIFYISYQTPNIILVKLFYIWKCFTAKQMEYEYTCSTIRKFILFGKEDQMIFLLMKWIKLSPLYHSLFFFLMNHYIILIQRVGGLSNPFFMFIFWENGCQIHILPNERKLPYMLAILFYYFYVIFKLVPKPYLNRTKRNRESLRTPIINFHIKKRIPIKKYHKDIYKIT